MSKKSENKILENNVQETREVTVQSASSKGWFVGLILFVLIGCGGYFLYQNPQIIEHLKSPTQEKKDDVFAQQIMQLQSQMASLQAQLVNLPAPDLTEFEDKVARLEKQNMNVIDSKADAAIVLGMLTRVDKLENRLDKLAKISDDGALILSAAMLVKDAAEEGGSFVYEAEILNQLTPETASIKKDVSVISEYAHNGVVSKNMLIHQFEDIYNAATTPEIDSKNWKERLNDKLSEYIKINKVGEATPQDLQKKEFDTIALLVAEGKIIKAVELMESSENSDIKQNQDLQNWLADARNMLNFNQAIRNIAAHCLAEMKINNLKNKE